MKNITLDPAKLLGFRLCSTEVSGMAPTDPANFALARQVLSAKIGTKGGGGTVGEKPIDS